ncbi:uncharacterized protein LOC135397153 [Ornithodoros turicata]|uniref:uncharacterized protein LOC135397153 n=1 Tax=Ornithodoros turicata TaxID=34597 RepID=UPI0031386379
MGMTTGHVVQASYTPEPCVSDADCVEGTLCVPHYNYSKSNPGQCRPMYFCVPVSYDDCACASPGYECRKKDCECSPFECVVIDNRDTRCDGSKGPRCREDQVCGYRRTGLYCFNCPCYGTHVAECVDVNPDQGTCPDSIIIINNDGSYTCEGCETIVNVLTGP